MNNITPHIEMRTKVIYSFQSEIHQGAGEVEFATRAATNVAREYYGDNNLKRKDVRPTKLVDFEGIARHHNYYYYQFILFWHKKNVVHNYKMYMTN